MTKTELIGQLGTSRGTLYRHMAKLGIDKGKNLTDEDIKRITYSIKGNTNVLQDKTRQSTEQNEIQKENNELKKKISLLENKITALEEDNRNLLLELSNSLAMHNEVNKQYSNFMIEMKSLMAPQQEIKTERADKINNIEEEKEDSRKKKKWWKGKN